MYYGHSHKMAAREGMGWPPNTHLREGCRKVNVVRLFPATFLTPSPKNKPKLLPHFSLSYEHASLFSIKQCPAATHRFYFLRRLGGGGAESTAGSCQLSIFIPI